MIRRPTETSGCAGGRVGSQNSAVFKNLFLRLCLASISCLGCANAKSGQVWREMDVRVFKGWGQDLCPFSESPSPTVKIDSRRAIYTTTELSWAQDRMSEGRFDEVASILCEHLSTRGATYGDAHPQTLTVFNAFGVLLRKRGENARSRRLFEDLAAASADYPREGRFLRQAILHNLGTTLYAQGYMAASQAVFERALSHAETSGDISSRHIGATLTNLAFAMEAQKDYAHAEAHHRRAVELRRDEGLASPLNLAASLNNLGANLTEQWRFAEGELLLKEGLSIRDDILGGENLNLGFSLANLATNALKSDRPAVAVEYAERLVKLRETALGRTHPETALAYQQLAHAQHANRDYGPSLRAARAALESRVPITQREASAVSDAARVSLRSATAPSALIVVRSAWELSEALPKIWLAHAAPELANEAFIAAQHIPASGTADAFARAAARGAASDRGFSDLALQFQIAEDARAALDSELASAIADGRTVDALRDARGAADHRLQAIERDLAGRFPQFFQFLKPQPIGIDSLISAQGGLGNDDALVLMTPGSKGMRGVIWVVTRHDGGAWAEIGLSSKQLDDVIAELRYDLDLASAYSLTIPAHGRSANFDTKKGHALYSALFGDPAITALLSNKSNWIIVPQGSLVGVPFAALVVSPPDDSSLDKSVPESLRATTWLGLSRTLSILPSVASLTTQVHTRTSSERIRFFGVGNPSFKGRSDEKPQAISAYFDERGSRVDRVQDLPVLPDSGLEIVQLAALLGASRQDYLLEDQASETELRLSHRRDQLAEANVIAFATHGLVSGDLRNTLVEPALALSPPATPTSSDDGLLTSSEVAQLQLNADLVLLSACRTAAGDSIGGEGLTGLARAFLAAGARSLLVSHWRVRDAVAARLTVRTVELMYIAPSASAPEALRAAMAEIATDTSADNAAISLSHPAIWAAFMIVGPQRSRAYTVAAPVHTSRNPM